MDEIHQRRKINIVVSRTRLRSGFMAPLGDHESSETFSLITTQYGPLTDTAAGIFSFLRDILLELKLVLQLTELEFIDNITDSSSLRTIRAHNCASKLKKCIIYISFSFLPICIK